MSAGRTEIRTEFTNRIINLVRSKAPRFMHPAIGRIRAGTRRFALSLATEGSVEFFDYLTRDPNILKLQAPDVPYY